MSDILQSFVETGRGIASSWSDQAWELVTRYENSPFRKRQRYFDLSKNYFQPDI